MRTGIRSAFIALVLAICVPATASAATTSYLTFLGHQMTALDTLMDVVDDVTYDLDIEDIDSAIVDLNRLYSLSNKEVKWLASHAPQPCYKKLHAVMKNEWTQYREAAAAGKKALVYIDYTALDDFTMHMNKANGYTRTATKMMKAGVCGVSGAA
jgi:hypothetical protein